MRRFILCLCLAICLSCFVCTTANAYSNDATIGSLTETNSKGMRFVYQTLPTKFHCVGDTTTFYKDFDMEIKLHGEEDGDFDSANMYGLEFFSIDNHTIKFGGVYTDIITASEGIATMDTTAFLAGFGAGYTNRKGVVGVEIAPYGQIGMCRYVTRYDDELTDDEESDWGLCYQGGLRGSLLFNLDPILIGASVGYIYYSQTYVTKTNDLHIDEVAEFHVTGSGATGGAYIGFLF